MNTPSRDAYVVDLRTNPGAFRVILGETSTGYGLRWTLWGRDEAALRQLDRPSFVSGYVRDLGFAPRKDTPRTLDTIGRPDYQRMTTLANDVARMGGIVLIRCPFDDPAEVAAHLEMMQTRHGWLRVGYLDGNRRVTVLESSRIEGGFQIGQRVRERSAFGLTGRIVRLGTLEGTDADEVRVQCYVVEFDSGKGAGRTSEFPSTHLEPVREEVTA